jgi:capsule polysaccharide modification protein KpsS
MKLINKKIFTEVDTILNSMILSYKQTSNSESFLSLQEPVDSILNELKKEKKEFQSKCYDLEIRLRAIRDILEKKE